MVLTAEGDFLLEDDNFESFKTGKWAMVSPTDSVLAKIHQARAYVFSNSVLCLGGSADDLGQECVAETHSLSLLSSMITKPRLDEAGDTQ